MITQQRLKELVSYNEDTGIFTRNLTTSPRALKGAIAGSARGDGYILFRVDSKRYYAHRLAWLYVHGEFPIKGLFIDHINQDQSDNRIANLRVATISANTRNQKLRVSSKSGVTGVSWSKRDKRWRAHIVVDGKGIHLGNFHSKLDAADARKRANVKYNYHENHGTSA